MDPNNQNQTSPPTLENKEVTPKSNMTLTVLITGLIVVSVVLVGYLFYNMQRRNQQTTPDQNYIQATIAPTVSPTPEIDEEVDAVDLGTDEADFDTIQEEINQL